MPTKQEKNVWWRNPSYVANVSYWHQFLVWLIRLATEWWLPGYFIWAYSAFFNKEYEKKKQRKGFNPYD